MSSLERLFSPGSIALIGASAEGRVRRFSSYLPAKCRGHNRKADRPHREGARPCLFLNIPANKPGLHQLGQQDIAQ